MKEIKQMIIKLFKYIKANITKKEIILASTGLGLVLIGFISWNVFFSRYYIFKGEEKQFLEAVKEFYYYHPAYLPKEGSIKTKTLAEVYEENRLEELKIPKGKDICDLNSWVKVYNDNGKYIYHTYLKCGNIESSVDHKGPEIILNGDNTINVSIGDEYKELGVKEVKDNKDGKIDISNVTINSSLVDTNKLGTYKVTYRVKDKMNNVTTIERTVRVVRNLTRIVQNATQNTEGYYQGYVINNYVDFSGMLFRIVKVNKDGTILLISEDSIANIRYTENKYKDSSAEKYLNEVFLKAIHDDSYIIDAEYCVGQIESFENIEGSCSEKIKSKVALLSVDEFMKTFNKKKESYLNKTLNFALSNHLSEKSINVIPKEKNYLGYIEDNNLALLKPVITIKSDLVVTSGVGTNSNPYKLEDYEYAKVGETLDKRIIGEYVNYSNMDFRIIDKNDEGIVLIAVDGLKKKTADNSNYNYLTVTIPAEEGYTYNPKEENNPGYIINNKYIDYINESNIISTKYNIPTNEQNKKYYELSTTDFTAKISIAKTYDLFSGLQITNGGYLYLYLDKSSDNKAFYLNNVTGLVYEEDYNKYGDYCVKPVITVSKDLIIKNGKGTAFDPYLISNR